MISKFMQGHSVMSVLVGVSLLSMILLLGQVWLNQQQQQTAKLWQYAQALQIAENQQSLRLLDLPCQRQVEQNQLQFRIYCNSEHIIVEYPLGKVNIRG
ncbi:DUF5374 domain-containing protein [Gallibacterium trehalosifermentans]|uniref:DUF5374 domain-containing protein n=1 Tax=Gallibacterium trehalosifermentans TaxID=516935 RepID=A0ABV6H1U1_9PAST